MFHHNPSNLTASETHSVDIDGDGTFDMTLGLVRIEGNQAQLRLGLYKFAKPELQRSTSQEAKRAVEEQPLSTQPSPLQTFLQSE